MRSQCRAGPKSAEGMDKILIRRTQCPCIYHQYSETIMVMTVETVYVRYYVYSICYLLCVCERCVGIAVEGDVASARVQQNMVVVVQDHLNKPTAQANIRNT